VLHGNNETGILQDLPGLAAAARGVPLHADVVQALGRVPLDLAASGVAYATFSGHKFGAPRGIGGVLVAPGAPALKAQAPGGGQERGLRGGTENVAGLAAAALALELASKSDPAPLRSLARRLTERLQAGIPGALSNSDPERGLPGFVNLCLPGLVGETVAAELSVRGFSVSAGSACGSGSMLPSRVVLAMGRPKDLALGALRITMGRGTSAADVDALAAALVEVAAKQRALA
jgi:cysteine desulfurase